MGSGPGDDAIYDQLAHSHDSSKQCGMEGSCAPFDIVLCDQKQKISNRYKSIFSYLMLKKATAHRQVYKRLSTTSLSDRGVSEKIVGWHIAGE